MHEIYVKGDAEQVAATAADEVRLRFNGWRKKPADPPAGQDSPPQNQTGGQPDPTPAPGAETPAPADEPTPPRRPRRGTTTT